MPVGMLSPTTSSSPISSRCFTMARSELPWAATRVTLPARRSGTIWSYQYGSARMQHVLEALGLRPSLGRQPGVPGVVEVRELVVVVDRRRRGVVRAAPDHELLLAVLGQRGRLVLALQGAVVPLVQPPGSLRSRSSAGRQRAARSRRSGWPGAAARCAPRRAAGRTRPAARRRAAPRPSPFSLRSTSTQPVNRFFAFHSLSPCRSRIRVDMPEILVVTARDWSP